MALSIWQAKRQLAYLAAQAIWPDAPGELVFSGGGFVSEDLEGNYLPGSATLDGPRVRTGTDKVKGATPFARVQCLDVEYDKGSNANRPREAMFRLWTLAGGGGVPGPGTQSRTQFDTHGENMVDGTNRNAVQGQGKSDGRDVDELLDAFLTSLGTVGFVAAVHGFQGYVTRKTAPSPVAGVSILRRAFDVCVSDVSEQNYYHRFRQVSGSSPAPGVVEIQMAPPPIRFDSTLGVIRRGEASADPAPTDPTTGGILVTDALDPMATSFDDFPGAGTWHYAIWAGYAETRSGALDRYAGRQLVTVVAA